MQNSIKILVLLFCGFQLAVGQGLWQDFDENQEDLLSSSSSLISEEPLSSTQEMMSSSSLILTSSSSAEVLSSSSLLSSSSEVQNLPGGPRDIPRASSGVSPAPNPSDTLTEVESATEARSDAESEFSKNPSPVQSVGPSTFEIPQAEPSEPVLDLPENAQEGPRETLIAPSKPTPLFPEKANSQSSSSEKASSSSAESLFKVPFQDDTQVRTQAPVTHIPLYKKDKGDYVSPRQAGFSSLALPGLGQFQIAGVGNKVRGSLYLISEIAIGFSIWYFGVEKQQEYIDKYIANQKANFSIHSFEVWAQGLSDEAANQNKNEEFSQRFDASRSSWCRSLYGIDTQGQNACIERSSSHLQFIQNQRFSPQNDEAFYQFIGSEKWVAGWSDSDLDSYEALVDEGAYQKLGSSKHQDQFNEARDNAEFYGSLRPWLITALVLNHLISAIDAAWAAETNNKNLYESPVKSSMSLTPEGEWRIAMSLGIQW